MANNKLSYENTKAERVRADWDRRHPLLDPSTNVPTALYTDENPATTIKGTGFKNREIAERTISLTSQLGVRYKQYWTIRAMRERATYHPHQTSGMRDAIAVFDTFLNKYQPPTPEERKEHEKEWIKYRELIGSMANAHSYGKNPSKEEVRRAREDLREGQMLCSKLLSRHQSTPMKFPLTAFTALFGGPGLHGYGRHDVDATISRIIINEEGLKEVVVSSAKNMPLGLIETSKTIKIHYNRKDEIASVEIEKRAGNITLEDIWKANRADETQCASFVGKDTNKVEHVKVTSCGNSQKTIKMSNSSLSSTNDPTWTCGTCTFIHVGKSKLEFLTCELCGTARSSLIDGSEKRTSTERVTPMKHKRAAISPHSSPDPPSSWGCLRAPTKKDIQGPCKRQKGLDRPPPQMDFLIVLDFEWTADAKRKMEPVSEITQFPSVAMRVTTGNVAANDYDSLPIDDRIPLDLKCPLTTKKMDATCFSVFDSYVRPTLNPRLTQFSIELTEITQEMVDAAPTIDVVLSNYVKWLKSLGLADSKGNRIGNWAFVTWGDCDIMSTLRLELLHKSIDLPPCFNRWINLKDDAMFRRHYNRKPRGGLRACVESVGATWEGRAHNGLVDSINTAKIVRDMVQSGFQFVRSTRGLDKNGIPFGAR